MWFVQMINWIFPGLLLAFVLASLVTVAAREPRDSRGSEVIILGDNNFTQTLTTDRPWFIKFYAPWCGHCKRLAPIWDFFSVEAKDRIKVAKVNCDLNPVTRATYQIYSYPTLVLFWKGQRIEYGGNRGVRSFVTWLEAHDAYPAPLPEPTDSTPAPSPANNVEEKQEEEGAKEIRQEKEGEGAKEAHEEPEELADARHLRGRPYRGDTEVVRLLLAEVGMDYNETRYSEQEWQQLVTAGLDSDLFLLGDTPVWSEGTLHLSGPLTILRYLGAKYGMVPEELLPSAVFDLVLEGAQTLRNEYIGLVTVEKSNFDVRSKEFMSQVLPAHLSRFAHILDRAAAKYMLGEQFTVADLYLWDVLTLFLGIDANCLNSSPILLEWFKYVGARANIQTYLLSEKRPKYANSDSAAYGNAQRPQQDSYPVGAKTVYHVS